jgi:hypothetical protein
MGSEKRRLIPTKVEHLTKEIVAFKNFMHAQKSREETIKYVQALQLARVSPAILLHQRKSKMRHKHVMLTVLKSVGNLASQMAQLMVWHVHHGSMMV